MAGTVKSDTLQRLTRICLDKLEEIELYPKVLACDQGSNYQSFLHKLEKVSVEKPYIVQNNKENICHI